MGAHLHYIDFMLGNGPMDNRTERTRSSDPVTVVHNRNSELRLVHYTFVDCYGISKREPATNGPKQWGEAHKWPDKSIWFPAPKAWQPTACN